MKIALITIHSANSYGGTLQALASQKILSNYGDVSIIDYKTTHLKKTMQLIRFGFKFRDFLRMGKDLFRLLPRYRLLNKFNNFMSENYHLTQECQNNDDLNKLEKYFDVFVCGSDQIWNPNIINEFDGAYFLNFVNIKKKISYASSAGSYQFSKSEEAILIDYLTSFSNISVREENTAQYISHLLEDRKVNTVLDPTLMLSKHEWKELLKLENQEMNRPYVLVYTLKKDQFVRNIVKQVSNQFNLDVIVIDQDPILGYPSDQHIQDASPQEYLELIAGASFVITNSFHGTAFSVNFEIPFISIKPESGLNRIENFLKSVGLQKRLILNEKELKGILESPIDFNNSREKLDEQRMESFKYLDQSFTDV